MKNNILYAIIPMKCHSERVPNKNIRDFAGKPLFYWILNTLKKIDRITKIIVDTDCEQIADMVLRYFDVVISMRPDNLKGDFVSVNKIIKNIIGNFDNEYFIQTHATNPLLKPETINSAIELYFKNTDKFDSVFSVTRYQSRFYDLSGNPINHNPAELIRTQDLSPLFEENSNFYIFSKQSFLKKELRIGDTPFMFEVNKLESVDIDDLFDFRIAESIMKISVEK